MRRKAKEEDNAPAGAQERMERDIEDARENMRSQDFSAGKGVESAEEDEGYLPSKSKPRKPKGYW